jgi:hypothetical protein
MIALILKEGKFSCVKAAKKFTSVSHDSLTRILQKEEVESNVDIENLPKGGALIADDTTIDKSYSKKLEGTSRVYSSSLKKTILGYCFITLIYVVGEDIYYLGKLFWQKGGDTKNELLKDKLKELKEKGLNPSIVLFDKWYAASETLNLLNDFGWKYLCPMKVNRCFKQKKEDNNKKNKYHKQKQLREHKFLGAKSLIGKLRGVAHEVQAVKHCGRYLVTNLDNVVTSYSGAIIYKKRWIIEEVFQALKSYLHLNDCSSRSFIAQKNHAEACLQALIFIKRKYPNLGPESAQSEFIKNFKVDMLNQYLLSLGAA